tara:strand:- start:1077 stop:1292 length:216 start_codon:yes stop_codon:yes gene_type:complete
MADDNLILEHLKAIRADQQDAANRLDRIETRLSSIEHTVGHIYAGAGDDREAMRAMARRIDRIERRLDLTE